MSRVRTLSGRRSGFPVSFMRQDASTLEALTGLGKEAQARAELEKVYAEDPDYKNVASRLKG